MWEGGHYSLFKQVACCCLTHKTNFSAIRLGTCSEENMDLSWSLTVNYIWFKHCMTNCVLLVFNQYLSVVAVFVCVKVLWEFVWGWGLSSAATVSHSCKRLTDGESLHLGAAFSAILNERSKVPAMLGPDPLLTGGRSSWHTWRGRHGHLMKAAGTDKQSATHTDKCGWKVYP